MICETHMNKPAREVGPIDCDTNANGGYDCECNTGYSAGNGKVC